MDIDSAYVRGLMASKLIGVSQQTLRKLADEGTIDSKKTEGGHRLYNVRKYLQKDKLKDSDKFKICYCRVSSYSQKAEYDNQVAYMREKYPEYKIIGDVGSGINFKRKGLRKIIDLAILGKLDTLVISYKDRLSRIGYDLIEFILVNYSGTKIIVDKHREETVQEEIANDLIEIMTVYTAKISGMRSYKKEGSEEESEFDLPI